MITPENVVRHELIGLKVRIASSDNPEIAGLSGRVIDESRNTLTIETPGKGEKRLIKDQCVFSFYLPSVRKRVKVDGKIIVARPEDRIKKKFEKW
jgi:ribonuclease P protein subunit POP4